MPGGDKKVKYKLKATCEQIVPSSHSTTPPGSPVGVMAASPAHAPAIRESWYSFSEQLDIANILKTSYRR